VQLAGDGGALFHDDQLLLFFLMPVERQRGRQLFNQRIHQLLLIVAQVTSGWQRRQQNAVLGVAVDSRHFRVVPPPVSGGRPRGQRWQPLSSQDISD
jgi:hypothetical protein